MHGGCCGWGWSYWGTNWHGNTIIYNRNIYVGNSYWRGGYYGGGYRPGYPGYRPGYPGYGRPPTYPPGNRPPATTLPAGQAIARMLQTVPGTRPGAGDSEYSAGQLREPSEPDSRVHRPSTNEARGYQRPQTSNTGATQAARPNAFSGSGGGRAQSARGNQSVAAKGGKGGASAASCANSYENRV